MTTNITPIKSPILLSEDELQKRMIEMDKKDLNSFVFINSSYVNFGALKHPFPNNDYFFRRMY
jgi:hypothetical protein